MATRKPRSPKYPQLPLRKAIERVGQVYRAERTHKAEKAAIAKDLGYGGLNGGSVSLIGTLKTYGLLSEDKEGVGVTGDAVTILRAPEGDADRREALLKVAFTPKVFAELRDAYGDDPDELPSDATMQYRLEKSGFLEKAAGEVIRTYRDNLEFVSEAEAEYTGFDEPIDDQPLEVEVQPQKPVVTPSVPNPGGFGVPAPTVTVEQGSLKEFLHVFAKDCEMRLLVDGVVTQEAIDRLIGYLQLGKEDLPSRKELEQPAIEQPDRRPIVEHLAEQHAIEMPPPEQ